MARRRTRKAEATWGGLPVGVKVLVDSAPIIYLLEDHPRFAQRFAGLFEAEESGEISIALSTITIAEVLAGPFKHRQDALAGRYAKTLAGYEVVPVSAEIAVSAARLRARYSLKLPDALQLATALDIGAHALVTHDRDFSGVTGLIVHIGE
jgi:predicted nucleic acid-binding protein